MVSLWIALLALFVHHIVALSTQVDLGYATYKGAAQADGVSKWLKMRFAKPPTPENGLRFVAPQDPDNEDGVQDATQFGPACMATGSKPTRTDLSEDCLYVNVFAPSNATNTSKLPVYVFLQAGGFNSDANAMTNGSQLIIASRMKMVIVVFNYRVGPYGFLASQEIAANSTMSLNNGLKDQRKGLEWVQQYIGMFGGDKDHVTLGGASAGGSSVVLHLTAYGGRNDNLFHAAAAESQAFPAIRTVTESQFQYDDLAKAAGCKKEDTLDCLASMNMSNFQTAANTLTHTAYPGASGPPIWFWNPTLDDDWIQDYTPNELAAGHFVAVPTIFGDDTNEGTTFTPKSVNSEQKAQQFIANNFVNFNKSATYLLDDKDDNDFAIPTSNSVNQGNQWFQVAADMYGHIRYICPGLNMSAAYALNGSYPTYNYRWNVGTATHISEMGGIWYGGSDAPHQFIRNYWISFITTFDPNKNLTSFTPPTGVASVPQPRWQDFGTGSGQRMLFGNNNSVAMETVTSQDLAKCKKINGLGIQLQQHSAAASNRTGLATWLPFLKYIVSTLCLSQWICCLI